MLKADDVEHQRQRRRDWKKANYEKNKESNARSRARNKQSAKLRAALYRQENAAEVRERKNRWRKTENGRASSRRYAQQQRSSIKGRIDDAFSANIRSALVGGKNGRKWEEVVGYTLDDLMRHLKRLFKTGMTWENYGRGGWHIDHKIPKSLFNYQTVDDIDFKRCWALRNLQPLWESENMKKGSKFEGTFQPSLPIKGS